MTDAPDDLVERVEAATGPDRELDADIAEQVHGWRYTTVGLDYDGKNASDILTEAGRLADGFAYPPRGKIPRYYHVPGHTRDATDPTIPKDYVRRLLASEIRARAAVDGGGE